jgi:hypothetical protein
MYAWLRLPNLSERKVSLLERVGTLRQRRGFLEGEGGGVFKFVLEQVKSIGFLASLYTI